MVGAKGWSRVMVLAVVAFLAGAAGTAGIALRHHRHRAPASRVERAVAGTSDDASAAVVVSVRLISSLVADREAILAFVPPNECPGRLASRPAATWGTLSARLQRAGYGERVLDRWRDDETVLSLSSEGDRRLHLASSEDELWLLLDGD